MDVTALTIFALAILVAAAAPGPAIAALLARVIGRGTAGVPAFIGGIVLGDLTWLAVAVLGSVIRREQLRADLYASSNMSALPIFSSSPGACGPPLRFLSM